MNLYKINHKLFLLESIISYEYIAFQLYLNHMFIQLHFPNINGLRHRHVLLESPRCLMLLIFAIVPHSFTKKKILK